MYSDDSHDWSSHGTLPAVGRVLLFVLWYVAFIVTTVERKSYCSEGPS